MSDGEGIDPTKTEEDDGLSDGCDDVSIIVGPDGAVKKK